ncbi:hypothetical protein GGR52DRAFT_133325 [Hypoxylon sp. FL1284]|nr:hypothetical protein GGR52DRAFT_133325 [Hypoxylon sp. FL1284]
MDSTDDLFLDESSASQPPRPSTPEEKDDESTAPKKAAVRKRTKTGCRTCRKRRIKCDEGRPTCNNCLKSKRNCEGYNQPLVFKDPVGAFSNAPFGPIPYPVPSPQALVREQLTAAQKSSSQALQIIAPKPPPLGYHQPPGFQFYAGHAGQTTSPLLDFNDPDAFGSPSVPSRYTFFPPTTVDAFSQHQWRQEPPPEFNQFSPIAPVGYTQGGHVELPQQHLGLPQLDEGRDHAEPGEPAQAAGPGLEEWENDFPEDASMCESDDVSINERRASLDFRELGVAAFQGPYDMFGTETRTFSSFAPESFLVTYEPSPVNSPLNDRKIAAVFWHFVNVTGPSISLYERHPHDPTPIFAGQPIPKARQHIWTYTFPILSFTHPALLHAILAIASLQMAKLQAVPPTASHKHYHLALRRIARNVGRPSRRAQPANLAATLVLAFYEVWSSDHDKWSRHLLGARLIIKEIPYADMTRAIMAVKMRQRLERQQAPADAFGGAFASYEESGPLHKDWDLIDMPLLSAIIGKDVSFDELEEDPEGAGQDAYHRPTDSYTARDMENYEQLSDLFWWYCKMDVYQSILGGTRLFMEYDAWTQCPPRAPMGRLDAIYGTYDHLVLLLGRLADFASKDLSRKREVLKANPGRGGSPNMFPGMVPRNPDNVMYPRGFTPPKDDSPEAAAATGPDDAKGPSPPLPPSSSFPENHPDLDASTSAAHREWEGIRRAFEALGARLAEPALSALDADAHPTATTPFGAAAHYRTYSVAGLWMNYYMGLIVLQRAHPAMPPVAMVAAGLSAATTAAHGREVGRIAAGLEENIGRLESVSTLMAAALIESCFPLFVAGIQFREDSQRQWLFRRLHDIARLTGWQSARQIAAGCESAWTKAAQMGRGPAYTRGSSAGEERSSHSHSHSPATPSSSSSSSVCVNARRIDRRIQEVEADETKIVLAKAEKAYYAMGLLAVERDLEKLDLDTGERDRS